MTATYDGKLIVTKDGIEPCCRMMDKAVFAGLVYRTTVNKAPVLALKGAGNRPFGFTYCPFCRAQAVMQ